MFGITKLATQSFVIQMPNKSFILGPLHFVSPRLSRSTSLGALSTLPLSLFRSCTDSLLFQMYRPSTSACESCWISALAYAFCACSQRSFETTITL